MKQIRRQPLTAEFVRSILDYDPATGILRWRFRPDAPKKWNTRYAGTIAGSKVKGYLQIQISNPEPTNYYAHQLAWCHFYGIWPENQIDHRFGIRDDNRIEELREATNGENGCNRPAQSNNKSGHKGVYFETQKKKWAASITKNGARVYREYFDTAEEAAEARRTKLAEIHGEFARH